MAQQPERSARIVCILLVMACLVGLCLRAHQLGAQELWGDEAMSTCMTQMPITQVIAPRIDVHPPLYYLLLWLWAPCSGRSLFALRYASVVLSLPTIALAYHLGSRLAGRGPGVVAAWLVAVSPLQVYYAQELRMYSLAGLLGTVGMLCVVQMLQRESPKALPWVGYWLSSVAAMYCHYQAFSLLAGQNLVVLLSWRRQCQRLLLWLGGMVGLAAAYLPWVLAQTRYLGGLSTNKPYALSLARLVLIVHQGVQAYVAGLTAPPDLAIAATLLALLVAAIGVFSLRRRTLSWLLLVAWPLSSLVVWWLADPLMPFFYPRFVVAGAPALLLLVAAGVVWIARRTPAGGLAVILLLVASSAVSLQRWYADPTYRKGDYGRALAEIAARAQPGDVIVLNNKEQMCLFDYYKPMGIPWALLKADDTVGPEETDKALRLLTYGHSRAWLITFGHIEVCDPQRNAEKWFGAHGYCGYYQSHQGFYVNLYLLGEPPETPPVTMAMQFADGIRLLGYDLRPQPAPAGGTIFVTLYWQVSAPPQADYTVSAQVLDERGTLVAQFDGQPANGARPTSGWQPNEIVIDSRAISLADVAPGTYSVWVGLYTWPDMVRLRLADGSRADALRLCEVTAR